MRPEPRTAFRAIARGDRNGLDEYLSQKGSPNAANDLGYSLLHEAAYQRQAEMVDLLLEAGARVNRRDADQRTPLTMALDTVATSAGKEPVSLLVTPGGLVRFDEIPPPDPDREIQRRIVSRLLQAGAQVNLTKRRGEVTTLARVGFKPPLSLAVEGGDRVLIRLLLYTGADPNAGDYFGDTPLIEAAFIADPAAVRILAAAGADPNLPDKNRRRTPLLWAINNHGRLPLRTAKDPDNAGERRAAARRSRRLVEALLDVGSRVDVEDRDGLTPLFACLKTGRLDLLRLLLREGADPQRQNRGGETAQSYLMKQNMQEKERTRLMRTLAGYSRLPLHGLT